MNDFTLDPRLAQDCVVLGKMRLSLLLLMKNSLVPWFILVPQRTATELFQLDRQDQAALLEEINLLSRFVKEHFAVEKLNVAAIGNIVQQLHIHVVGRNSNDFCWPNVVWGTKEQRPYTDQEVKAITAALGKKMPLDALQLS
ncbi:MAG: HIT family protein [Geobacteraceae bacterium]|nr:HIT family protein [Geobacteraceae bacterium]